MIPSAAAEICSGKQKPFSSLVSKEKLIWEQRRSTERDRYVLRVGSTCCFQHGLLEEGFPWWLRKQRICLQCRSPGFDPWVRRILWRREGQRTPVFLPGEIHGQRSLVGSLGSQRVGHDWATKTSTFTNQKSLLLKSLPGTNVWTGRRLAYSNQIIGTPNKNPNQDNQQGPTI